MKASLTRVGLWASGVLCTLYVLPGLLGFLYALLWLPVYGGVCGLGEGSGGIFSAPVSADGYRVFLLNKGCDLQTVRRGVVSRYAGTTTDSASLLALLDSNEPARTSDQVMILDAVKAELRTWTPIDMCLYEPTRNASPSGTGFPEVEDILRRSLEGIDCTYRGTQPYFSDDMIGRLFGWIAEGYLAHARRNLFSAVNGSVDVLVPLINQSPVIRGGLFLLYALIALVVGNLGAQIVSDLLFRRRQNGPS